MTEYRSQASDTQHGFTLVEVMVALVIFAVLSVTLLVRLGDNIRTEQYLESKTIALMIAENKLADLRIKEEWSSVRNDRDTVQMAGQDWQVETVVTDTADENLRRVDVLVGPDDGQSAGGGHIVTLTSYIGQY